MCLSSHYSGNPCTPPWGLVKEIRNLFVVNEKRILYCLPVVLPTQIVCYAKEPQLHGKLQIVKAYNSLEFFQYLIYKGSR